MKGFCTAAFLGGLAFVLYMVVEQAARHEHGHPLKGAPIQSSTARPLGAAIWH
jgi:hypothetical protein